MEGRWAVRVMAVPYFFPPVGGAGVQRNLRLVSHLENLEVEIVVLTGQGHLTSRWAPRDESLAAETPLGLEIHRLRAAEPSISPYRARLERLARVESEWGRWWKRGIVYEGCAVEGRFDLLWALMQPYASSHAVGRLSSRLGVPWVADLADPWALDEMLIYPTGVHRRLAMREMRRALASAAGIVMSTREAAQRLTDVFPELASRPILVGPVGWDRRDFESPPPTRPDDVFRIVHTGYLHTELGRDQRRSAWLRRWLGGSRDDVDILARSHVHLVEALDALFESRPELEGRVELHLAGVQSPIDQYVSGRRSPIRWLGYVDHTDAVALMRTADLLFLPMHGLPDGTRASIVPGKTYEYLASGRPILAAIPEGDAWDLLEEAGSASICRPTDVVAMTTILSERIDAFLAGKTTPAPKAQVVERYEYRRLAADLLAFFEAISKRAPSNSGAG